MKLFKAQISSIFHFDPVSDGQMAHIHMYKQNYLLISNWFPTTRREPEKPVTQMFKNNNVTPKTNTLFTLESEQQKPQQDILKYIWNKTLLE